VFVANPYDNSGTGTIGVFAINATTGALTAANGDPALPAFVPAATDNNPIGFAVDPTGPYLYVGNAGTANQVVGPPKTTTDNDVATYTIAANGTLTAGSPVALAANDEPSALAFDSAGPYLYVGNNDIQGDGAIVAFNPVAGVLGAQLAGSPYTVNYPIGMAVDSTHAFVFAVSVPDVTITTYPIGIGGTLTVSAPPTSTALAAPYAVAAYPSGQYVYVTDTSTTPGTVNVFSYDGTGTLTLVLTKTVGTNPESVAVDPTGKYLYVANAGDGTVQGFRITSSGAGLTAIGTGATATGGGASISATALAIDPSSQYLYVANGDASTITGFSIGALGVLGAASTPVQATNLNGANTIAIAIE
jgi:6-phosphogluconolactonase (cycloisomerase 2 family)